MTQKHTQLKWLAKKQVINMKYFVVILIIFGLVFSLALSISTSVYTYLDFKFAGTFMSTNEVDCYHLLSVLILLI